MLHIDRYFLHLQYVVFQQNRRLTDISCGLYGGLLGGRSCRLCQGSEWPFSVESLQTITTGIPPNKASVPSLSIPQYPASTAISEVSLGQIKKADFGK